MYHSVKVYLLWFRAIDIQLANLVRLSHIQSISISFSSVALNLVFLLKTSKIPDTVRCFLSGVNRMQLSNQWCFISSLHCYLKASMVVALKSCSKHNIFVKGSGVMALSNSSAMLIGLATILSSAPWFSCQFSLSFILTGNLWRVGFQSSLGLWDDVTQLNVCYTS